MTGVEKSLNFGCFHELHALHAGVSSKNFNKGALGAMSENGCGSFAATPIFLKVET